MGQKYLLTVSAGKQMFFRCLVICFHQNLDCLWCLISDVNKTKLQTSAQYAESEISYNKVNSKIIITECYQGFTAVVTCRQLLFENKSQETTDNLNKYPSALQKILQHGFFIYKSIVLSFLCNC